ncbi:MAG: cytochrome bc complex cytochrome b subunit [Nitrososphaerota archaeon]|nr:cytochrome bc complex cytochrome b subunit [Nitrososphaerota archaeon]MDG7023409.1 cytochrome bc complex cytochrome b subunit [Nitrososphaerota archaeon]
MSQQQPKGNVVSRLYQWIKNGLDRTYWMGISFTYPKRFVSPLGYLGVLTGITFLVLGVTGGLLMIYYQPTLSGCGNLTCAFASVERINNSVPFGWLLRNIHYTASNAMVLLAVLHMYYQYFSGRFKIKNEILWVTGVIFGIITGLEAFSGYDLLFNQRAGLAIEIGSSLANASPLIGGTLRLAVFGAGFTDFVLRLYAYHTFVLPMIMILLVFLHFPRYLVFDLPVISTVVGGLFLVAAIFPVALNVPYSPSNPQLTIPEWYLTGIYALLRTEFDKFVMGGLMPALLFLMAIVVPFVDTSKKLNWKDRPFFTALGITTIAQIIITTAWGFYINPDTNLPTLSRLFVNPGVYFSSMLGVTVLSFAFTYAFLRYLKNKERVRKAVAPASPLLTKKWVMIIFLVLVGAQIALNFFAWTAALTDLNAMTLFDAGAVLVTFGVIVHLYRYSQSLPF